MHIFYTNSGIARHGLLLCSERMGVVLFSS